MTTTNSTNKANLSQSQIEALPNYRKRTVNGEYSSACPVCGGDPARDTDRFRFWPEKGNFWCGKCGLEGFVGGDSSLELFRITPEIKAELERKEAERRAAERNSQKSAIARLRERKSHILYHRNVAAQIPHLQQMWGIDSSTIDYFKIGYCRACPTYPMSDSVTIPYTWRGELINIRHRLLSPGDSGKYRPEMAGLPNAIFNADLLNEDNGFIILVEGEFKAMVLWQFGLPAIAIPGASTFKESWSRLFNKVERVFVALDPGVEDQAYRIGVALSKAGLITRIATLPDKPDDMLIRYNCDLGTFCRFLELGRTI
jgi:hypothetical protein